MKKFLIFLVAAVTSALILGTPAVLADLARARTMSTHSDSQSVSIDEGFEGTTFPPPGWRTTTAGLPLPHAWHRTTDPDYRGTGRASAYVGSESPSAIDEWLITPVVALSASDKTIKFSWSGNTHWSSALDASLNVREVGTKDWARLWSIARNESPADPFVYRERFVDLSAWTDKKVEFGFRVVGTKGASFGLDDIAVGNFAAPNKILFPVDTTCAASTARATKRPWRVVNVRQSGVEDAPFETRTGYLRSPASGNYMPGPDSLVAQVVIVANRGYVEIMNVRTGKSRRLLETGAYLPHWSPDGKLISCLVWTRETWAGKLTVVDVATSKIVLENDLTHASNSKWSPDSRTIAVSGLAYKWRGAFLYTVTVPEGRVAVIDSLSELATHDFSWSPDGRWIAFSRPTQLDHYEETIAADLWIADAATGESWCILEAPEWAESDPLWITNRSLQITRVRRTEDGEESERVVLELSLAP
jgi:hypothetical protein